MKPLFSPYFKAFSLGMREILTYRLNFLFARLNNLILIISLFFLWTAVFGYNQTLFGFSRPQIITYVLGASLLYSFIFVQGMHKIAFDITQGDLSNYLIKPINYFQYWFARNNAHRVIFALCAIIEVGIIVLAISEPLFVQQHISRILLSICAVACALLAYQLIDFILGISAFWFYKSFGLRWALQTTIAFTSGYIFPLDILPAWMNKILQLTPFPYMIHFPLKVYLGLLNAQELTTGFVILGIWIIILSLGKKILWKRGLQTFDGAGR